MHSRGGGQVPFISINYGTDMSKEGRLLVRQLLKATQAGLGKGETPIFPIQIFKMKKGVNFEECDPNYDLFELALETTAE
ncbi:anaerobic ribonucleoside triphosphate reductase, partial [Escherichia coli]|nr:anaerobic ribonucleoside triphosphate reductase [Escherichia coli]